MIRAWVFGEIPFPSRLWTTPSVAILFGTGCVRTEGWVSRKVGFRGGWGLALPDRRTFAAGILPAVLSKETSFRHRGCRRFPPPIELTRANPPTHNVSRGTVSRERSGLHPPRRAERGSLIQKSARSA